MPIASRRGSAFVATALLLAGAPTALSHTDHLSTDTVRASPAEVDRAATAFAARVAPLARLQALAGPDAHLVGSWGGPQAWPFAPVNAALLTDGRILAYENAPRIDGQPFATPAMVWDPGSGAVTRVDTDTGYNIFCSGFSHLPDGRLFVAGGDLNYTTTGIPQTHTFSPATGAWDLGVNMTQGERWYPGVTPLANGEMLIAEGGPDTPEVRTTTGTMRPLTNIQNQMAGRVFPWIQVAPNGRAVSVGPDRNMWSIDTAGSGSIDFAGQRDADSRSYGTYAMYDVGKILVAGGARPALATTRVIDINGSTPTSTPAAPMAFARRHANATVLPDGTVLVTGGFSGNEDLVDVAAATRSAELWNPATNQWTTLAAESTPRQYHSVALLLPDGRVLSGGGGAACGPCTQVGYIAQSYEIFTPPYLYRRDGSGTLAPRPAISAAPSTLAYGQTASVATPQAADIRKVVLVRLSAVTHAANTAQRYIPLTFSAGAGSLQITAPATANIAPPGHYMLFIVDSAGVPSVASMVAVGATGTPTPPGAPTLNSAVPGGNRVTLGWSVVGGASGYTVAYAPAAGGLEVSVDAGIATSLAVTGLTNGTPYSFTVRARNGGGVGPPSNALTATPSPPAGATTLRVAGVGDGRVSLAWAAVPGAGGYVVRRGTSPGVYSSSTAVGAVTTSSVTGLANETAYYFTVAPQTTSGDGPDSNEVSATPGPPPPAPDLYPATAGDRQVTLAWSRVPTATGFVLRWGTEPGSTEFQRVLGTTDTATVPDLANGTTYYFTLVATNAAGAGAPSVERSAVPGGMPAIATPPPLAPARSQAPPGATIASFVPRGTGRGLLGSYFANADLRGRPVLARTERVAFRWGRGAPARGLPADGFSVRWRGRLEAPETGVYRLAASADDSVQVWVGKRLVIDTAARRSGADEVSLTLAAGRRYPIRVEYRDRAGHADVQLRWRLPGRSRQSALARSRLYAPR